MSKATDNAESNKSAFATPPKANYRRISDTQANLSNGNNRPWYLDVDYMEEVGFEKAFAGAERAA